MRFCGSVARERKESWRSLRVCGGVSGGRSAVLVV